MFTLLGFLGSLAYLLSGKLMGGIHSNICTAPAAGPRLQGDREEEKIRNDSGKMTYICFGPELKHCQVEVQEKYIWT